VRDSGFVWLVYWGLKQEGGAVLLKAMLVSGEW